MTHNPCPLCHSVKTLFFTNAMNRDYFLCTHCKLIFVSKSFLLNKTEEKKRYDLHENSIDDVGYVQFISQIIQPLCDRLTPNSFGLDFGSGPAPVLAELLKRSGFRINIYDPFYAKKTSVLNQKYDFITLVEVAEHFFNPSQEFESLVRLLKPNGYLAVMTSSTDNIHNFPNWHYQKDDTHVCFYATNSMKYLAKKYKLSLEIISERVFIFQKV